MTFPGKPLALIPPVGWMIAVLAIFALGCLPLVFWGLARTGKRGLAWITLPILSVVATGGLWLFAARQSTP